MEALVYLEASLTESGYPVWLTTGLDAAGRFTAKSHMDFAMEALERARQQEGDPQPGRRWTVTFDG